MTQHLIPKLTPKVIHGERFDNNGQVPSGILMNRIAYGIDWLAHWAKKTVIQKWDDLLTPADPSSASRSLWYAYTVTGEATAMIRHQIGLAKASNGAATDPYVYLDVIEAGGSPAPSDELHYSGNDPSTAIVAPGDVHHGYIDVAVDPNTEYTFTLIAEDYARPLYWVAFEIPVGYRVDDTDDGIMSPAPYLTEGPIRASDVEQYLEACTRIRKHNAQHLLWWSAAATPTGNSPSTRTANTYGGHTASAGEYHLDVYHRRTVAREIPCRFAALAGTTAGSTNGIRIIDTDSSTQLAEITGYSAAVATPEWLFVDFMLPETTEAVTIQMKSDGAATFTMYAYTLMDYEA